MKFAISPCPNDTYIFYALIHRKIKTKFEFTFEYHDLDRLNQMASDFEGPIKVSYARAFHLGRRILNCGGALGHGCGPLLVSRTAGVHLEPVAIPGLHTTANLLLTLFFPHLQKKTVYPYHKIEDLVLAGHASSGLLIHENRFTCEGRGLVKIADLGSLWEERMHMPVPLGCIVIPSSLNDRQAELEAEIRQSILYAGEHQKEVLAFCVRHAQEMSYEIMLAHINLYVNAYSSGLDSKAEESIHHLRQIALSGADLV